jgi:hypothetical protein
MMASKNDNKCKYATDVTEEEASLKKKMIGDDDGDDDNNNDSSSSIDYDYSTETEEDVSSKEEMNIPTSFEDELLIR